MSPLVSERKVQRSTWGSGQQQHSTTSLPPTASLPAGPPPCPDFKASRPQPEHLCPCLLVPEGMELVFAVRELLTRERQQVSFCIVDLEGKPLSHVIVSEVGPQCGIHMQLLNNIPLAWVRTKMLYEEPRGLPEICWPSGEVFCTVAPESKPNAGAHNGPCYELRDTCGRRLYSVHGDFQEKAINIVSRTGQPVCATERCTLPFDEKPYYQVRVAPCIDAGLMLCGLLALEKLEGAGSGPTAPDEGIRPCRPSPRSPGAGRNATDTECDCIGGPTPRRPSTAC